VIGLEEVEGRAISELDGESTSNLALTQIIINESVESPTPGPLEG